MTTELIKLTGTHVFSGKKIEIKFVIRRNKGERPIDVLLDNYDLGGVHVHKVTKLKMPRVTVVDAATWATAPRR